MAESLQEQILKLCISIDGLEAQRGALGGAIVNPALAALRNQLAALDEQATVLAAPAEERRLMTFLFMDLVGSTAMAEKLYPEEWRQVVSRLHAMLAGAITAHHGSIAQYLGDGVLAFFGAKHTNEQDPENAIRAALQGQAGAGNMLSSGKVQLRAGIHTGLVVVGELGEADHKEFTASGDAVNLAARLQSAAPPGGVLISHATYRYVRGVFDLATQPPLTVKGKGEPLRTYLVLRARPRPFRSVTRGVAGVETRTIGREAEMQALQAAYLRAYQGHSVVWAQLLGNPGMGKSRLVEDMSEWMDLRDETYRLLRARAFPDDANQPFSLVRRMWFDRFQIAENAPLEQAEAKWVERFKVFLGRDDCEEAAHALGLLVGLTFENSRYIKAMRKEPAQVKGRAFVVSRELFRNIRQQHPVVVLLEDIHWIDSSSWEYFTEVLLDMTTGELSNCLFILGAASPEWSPPQELEELFNLSKPVTNNSEIQGSEKWGIQIPVAPLTDQASILLVNEIFQRSVDIPAQIIDLIVKRSEGVPYYSEEMVNWFIDRGVLDTSVEPWCFYPERLHEEPLPATLQHLLQARLSSLSQMEQSTLQRGAIFGRYFWTGGVEALGVSDGAQKLGLLQPRGFVEVQPESRFSGDTEWRFHHNLLREVTYESVLKRERAALHGVAAGWLESQARQAGRLDEFAGLLGDHYLKSGELSTAADWYLQAGKRAMTQGAPREAAGFYTRTLELLSPDDQERRWQASLRREEALTVLGEAEPWKADITALLELARSFEDDNYLAEADLRYATYLTIIGDDHLCALVSREALEVSQRCGNKAIEVIVLSLIAQAEIAWAEKTSTICFIEEAIRSARRLDDQGVLAIILFRAAWCYHYFGDFARSVPLQIEQIELDHRLGNRSMEAHGLGNLASMYLDMGLYKQSLQYIKLEQEISEILGARRGIAYCFNSFGELYWKIGDLRKAIQSYMQAQNEIAPTEDIWGKIVILQSLGMVLLEMGDATGAARRLIEARELAFNNDLEILVCESNSSLAACAVRQGNLVEAREFVGEAWNFLNEHGSAGITSIGVVYHRLAETFDALGETENYLAVLYSAHQVLMETADKISVPEWRQSYLENVRENRAILDMWERSRL